jgi:hypothetical protein
VTIKLIDTQAERQYEEDVETYRAKADKLMEQGKPWPMDFRHPQRPEALADSCDKGDKGHGSYGADPFGSPVGLGGTQYPQTDNIELDGSSRKKLEGWDSRWNADRDNEARPFANLKKK